MNAYICIIVYCFGVFKKKNGIEILWIKYINLMITSQGGFTWQGKLVSLKKKVALRLQSDT